MKLSTFDQYQRRSMQSSSLNQELATLVLEVFAARSNWDEYSQDKGSSICTIFKACQDPALLAQATLDGDSELVNTLLTGAPDPFMSELQELVEVQKASNYKPGWVLNQLFKAHPEATLTRDQWVLLGCELGFKPGWAYQKWQEFGGASHEAEPG